MTRTRLVEMLIDDSTWAAGSPARRQEWRLAIREILQEGVFDTTPGGEQHALLTLAPSHVVLEVRLPSGRPTARAEIPSAELRPLMADYLGICIDMGKLGVGSNSPRLEALDIAKRLAHDEAGEALLVHLRPVGADLSTARRFFTLLVTLFHDTTKLTARPHTWHA